MKKYLILIVVLVAVFASCDKDNKGRLDANAKIKIIGTQHFSKAAGERIHGTHCTDSVSFVSRYAYMWQCRQIIPGYEGYEGGSSLGTDRASYSKINDTINNRFFWWGMGVINPDTGGLGEYVMNCQDIVFVAFVDEETDKILFPWEVTESNKYPLLEGIRFDTIAYIPNSVVLKARAEITEALNREDFTECYRLFDEAFVYVPITGEKWRALKAAGIE